MSTRKVDDLVAALGVESGTSKSEVSQICSQPDTAVAAWRERDLSSQATPYVFLDATYCKARVNGRVVARAVVIATGVTADGHRESSSASTSVTARPRTSGPSSCAACVTAGLHGVQLVISDAHRGLTNAIATVCAGAAWQRCRVHFMRNALAKVSNGYADIVALAIRTILTQSTGPGVRKHVETVAQTLDQQFPAVAALLRNARADITAFAEFLEAHWRKIWSTNLLERLNREVRRRTDVVGIFHDDHALLRLAACALIEAHDEWQVSDRRYLSESSMAQLTPPAPTALQPRYGNDGDTSEVIDTDTTKTA